MASSQQQVRSRQLGATLCLCLSARGRATQLTHVRLQTRPVGALLQLATGLVLWVKPTHVEGTQYDDMAASSTETVAQLKRRWLAAKKLDCDPSLEPAPGEARPWWRAFS